MRRWNPCELTIPSSSRAPRAGALYRFAVPRPLKGNVMRNWNHPDWDQQLFNRMVLIADAAPEHGLPQAWFS